MSYIGADDLVFNNGENGIHSGGFSVKSIMMNNNISPIMTLNTDTVQKGGSPQVSDLFNNLVVPNWVLSYHNKMGGKPVEKYESESDSDEDDVIDDDLHDKLLELVKHHDTKIKEKEKEKNKNKKGTKKYIKNTKKNTKKKEKK